MNKHNKHLGMVVFIMIFGSMFFFTKNIYAHCDTLDGPVVETAKKALASGDVTPLLKWVSADDEKMIRTAFQKTLEVRKLGPQARNLADMYFFETLVRIHRAGEGAPYTGLKPGTAVDPAVALADNALESGSVDKLVNILTDATSKGIRERFHRALKAKKHADESVAAGREFVESYVIFTHYVEGLHTIIKGASEHHEHK
ncbi:MAG: hypothetical protein JRG87_07190 [Deltaproteobacteria bacterium]|nr:hypothetical protein [Deltaproteobacteria bacterium]MBW1747836.1 hypothetical protein [Deltaproteobacteria bacterium]MBW1826743.1 hypothetical protein [Deltaproteobacteria bacterium]MBW2156420.1 hypothetical protein [Deltaproteobacteria bacterium]MBW2198796.1 hypothetical protein [Deltaproteobacteria bacterium]